MDGQPLNHTPQPHTHCMSKPCLNPQRSEFRIEWQAAMKTKRALSSVSKYWRNIAVEYLLEILFVKGALLPERLEAPNLFNINGSARPFRFVKHLHAANYDFNGSEVDPSPLLRLIKACPNLSTYEHHANCYPASYLASLLGICGKTLRRLSLYRMPLEAGFCDTLSVMAPHLEQLIFGDGLAELVVLELRNSVLSLPSLHTLMAHKTYIFTIPTLNLPSLQTVKFGYHRSSFHHLQSVAFLTRLSNQLKYLDLSTVPSIPVSEILAMFPNLEALVVYHGLRGSWARLSGQYPALRELGVHVPWQHTTDDSIDYDFEEPVPLRGLASCKLDDLFEPLTSRELFPSFETLYLWNLREGVIGGDGDAGEDEDVGENAFSEDEEDYMDAVHNDWDFEWVVSPRLARRWCRKWDRRFQAAGIRIKNGYGTVVRLL